MNTNTSTFPLTQKILFWGLIGPFFLIATVIFQHLQEEKMMMVSLLSLAGLFACWQWRMQGLAATLLCFFCYFIVCSVYAPAYQQFWHLGYTLSLAMSLVITTLCLEEVEEMTNAMVKESKSRLDTLVQVDEKRRATENAWQKDKIALTQSLQQFRQDFEKAQHRNLLYQKQLAVAREDRENLAKEKQKAVNDLHTIQTTLQVQKEKNLENPKKKIQELQKTCKNRLELLNQCRCDLYQLRIQSKKRSHHYWKQAEQLKSAQARYLQLRKQFAEKQNVLEETKQALQQSKEQVLSITHKNTEKILEDLPFLAFYSHDTEKLLDKKELEIGQLEKQLQETEELVSSLMTEIASSQMHCLL